MNLIAAYLLYWYVNPHGTLSRHTVTHCDAVECELGKQYWRQSSTMALQRANDDGDDDWSGAA